MELENFISAITKIGQRVLNTDHKKVNYRPPTSPICLLIFIESENFTSVITNKSQKWANINQRAKK